MTDHEDRLQRLATALGIGLIVNEVEAGPPVRIVATAILDGDSTELVGVGPTEDEAWTDLGRAAIEWKGHDPRNIRTFWGGL
jgi:hypothetical protein